MRVNVLLSTYNGSKYIKEQINSVLNQEGIDVLLFVRDDGSTDDTCNILKEYSSYQNVNLYFEKNIGCINSFFRLMDIAKECPQKGEYYAFCDQDDIWLPNKLFEGITAIKELNNNKPCMYCSNLYVVDKDLNYIKMMYNDFIQPNISTCLVENIATGCTIIINNCAVDFLSFKRPHYIIMHDWWIYCICILFGEVYFDKNAYIKYRQHGNNTIGIQKEGILVKLKQLFTNKNIHFREKAAQEILNLYTNNLDFYTLNKVDLVAHYRKSFIKRMRLIMSKDIIAANKYANLRLKIRILFGLI